MNGPPQRRDDPLAPGEVRLSWATPASVPAQLLLDHLPALPPEEQGAVARYVFAADRRMAAVARLLVRCALSDVGGLGAMDWQFARTAYGQPTIANPGFGWLAFSLSHTRSMVVCAVARHAQLGVDVEAVSDRRVPVELADRCLTPEEAAEVRRLAPSRRPPRFLQYWTLKEAYLKARGLGLSVPLDGFSYRLTNGEVAVAFTPAIPADDPDRWRFWSGSIDVDHLLAVALAPAPPAPLVLAIDRAEPLLRRHLAR
jgi:4'-phosphopantetheinyl transferase